MDDGFNKKPDQLRKDDAILNCCLFFKQDVPHALGVKRNSRRVILVSNDRNFIQKAAFNHIETMNPRSCGQLMQQLCEKKLVLQDQVSGEEYKRLLSPTVVDFNSGPRSGKKSNRRRRKSRGRSRSPGPGQSPRFRRQTQSPNNARRRQTKSPNFPHRQQQQRPGQSPRFQQRKSPKFRQQSGQSPRFQQRKSPKFRRQSGQSPKFRRQTKSPRFRRQSGQSPRFKQNQSPKFRSEATSPNFRRQWAHKQPGQDQYYHIQQLKVRVKGTGRSPGLALQTDSPNVHRKSPKLCKLGWIKTARGANARSPAKTPVELAKIGTRLFSPKLSAAVGCGKENF